MLRLAIGAIVGFAALLLFAALAAIIRSGQISREEEKRDKQKGGAPWDMTPRK